MERKEVVRLSSDLLREALSSNGNEAAFAKLGIRPEILMEGAGHA